jgi:hypothetical protein
MALSAEVRGMMGFLVVMASEAGLARTNLPCVGCVTADAGDVYVFALLVQPAELAVARSAVAHGLEFCFFKMTCFAGHRHHRSGSVKFMTRDAVEGWPVACTVAKVAQDLGMFSLERPWVPRFCAGGGESSKGQKRSSLG